MTVPTLRELQRSAAGIPVPADYFAGACARGAAVPFNVLVFSRLNRRAMQPRDAFRHRRFVLAVNLAGEASIALGGRWQVVSRGKGVLVFPNQVHAFGRFRSREVCWLFVTFELADPAGLEELRGRVGAVGPGVMRWLGELVRHWGEGGAKAATASPYLAGLVLHEWKAQLAEPAKVENGGGAAAQSTDAPSFVLPRVHAMIEQGPPAGGLKSLARELGISESHLRAEFRRQSGRSLGRYLRDARLKYAAQLLRGTRRPVGEVAQACGFNSADAFARAFRRAVGATPRAYRKRDREAAP